MMRHLSDCSASALRFSAAKQWIVITYSNNEEGDGGQAMCGELGDTQTNK